LVEGSYIWRRGTSQSSISRRQHAASGWAATSGHNLALGGNLGASLYSVPKIIFSSLGVSVLCGELLPASDMEIPC
jgi:hypothetical protein